MTEFDGLPNLPEADREMVFLIQADIDGELTPAEAARVAAYLERSPDAVVLRDMLASLSVRAKGELSTFVAPDDLRRRIENRLYSESRVGAPPRRSFLSRLQLVAGTSFGAGLAVAAALLLAIVPPATGPDLAAAVVADHVRALQPGHLLDVVSTDHHTVRPWFDGRLDFAPPTKDLQKAGYPMRGGRLDYLDGRPVAAIVYAAGPHLIDLYIWPASGDVPQASGERAGYNYIRWQQDGMQFWAVSDVAADELAAFVRTWRNE